MASRLRADWSRPLITDRLLPMVDLVWPAGLGMLDGAIASGGSIVLCRGLVPPGRGWIAQEDGDRVEEW